MKALVCVLALASGCAIEDAPEVGSELTGRCDNADSAPRTPVSFAAEVHPLMTRAMGGCTCHQGRQTSGLDISSYASLRRGGINSGDRVIVAGDPCGSILLQKISETPPFGSRMPLNGPPYLSPDQIQLVHDWVAEGALDN